MANSDLPFALELADLAADVSMKTFRRAELTVETKADGSPVTEVDRTSRVFYAMRLPGTTHLTVSLAKRSSPLLYGAPLPRRPLDARGCKRRN